MGMRYSPPAQRPRSISLHRSPQNGRKGFPSKVVSLWHVGHFIAGGPSRCLVKNSPPDEEGTAAAKRGRGGHPQTICRFVKILHLYDLPAMTSFGSLLVGASIYFSAFPASAEAGWTRRLLMPSSGGAFQPPHTIFPIRSYSMLPVISTR